VRRRIIRCGVGCLCSGSHRGLAADTKPGVHCACTPTGSSHPLQGRLIGHSTRPQPRHFSSRLDNEPCVLLY
jgi:hypothetical protein